MFVNASRVAGFPSGVGDPGASRTVYAIVIGLAVIGVALIWLGIWLIRRTRIDPELLGPLERMNDRSWRKLDPVGRRRVLDEVRPDGAEPVHRMPTVPDVDDDFERPETVVPSFEDLERIAAELEIAGGAERAGFDGGSTGAGVETVRLDPDEPVADAGTVGIPDDGEAVEDDATAPNVEDDAAALTVEDDATALTVEDDATALTVEDDATALTVEDAAALTDDDR